MLMKFHVPFDFGELEQHFVKAWVLDLPVCASHALHLFDQSLRDLGMVGAVDVMAGVVEEWAFDESLRDVGMVEGGGCGGCHV